MVFKKSLAISLLFCLGLASLFLIQIFFLSFKTSGSVDQIVHELPKQSRKGIEKTVYFCEDGERRKTRIRSPNSTLTLHPKKGGFELIEKMHAMETFYQDKNQEMRYLKADEGLYDYKTNTFFAHEVYLAFYRDSEDFGNFSTRPLPYLEGIARQVSMIFSDQDLDLKAEAFQAHLQNPSLVK